MINWTQKGAGLANAGITPQQLQGYYGNALENYNYANTNRGAAPNPLAAPTTMRANPFDTNSQMIARSGIGYNPAQGQAAAKQQNAQAAGLPITVLSGYMERQGLGNSTQIANNIAKNGLAPVQQHLAPARDWELRETVRGNVQGPRGIVGLGHAAAPYIMGYAAGGFANPFASVGKAASGSFLKSVPNKLLSNALTKFTTPTGLAQQAQSSLMKQVRRG